MEPVNRHAVRAQLELLNKIDNRASGAASFIAYAAHDLAESATRKAEFLTSVIDDDPCLVDRKHHRALRDASEACWRVAEQIAADALKRIEALGVSIAKEAEALS